MAGRGGAREPPQVVVEHLLQADLAAQRLLKDLRALQRLGAAVDGPDLEAPDRLDEVARREGEVARAAEVPGISTSTRFAFFGPYWSTQTWLYWAGPGASRGRDRDPRLAGGGRRGERQAE